jgi:chromate transporter
VNDRIINDLELNKRLLNLNIIANKATNSVKKIKAYIFLKDVFSIAITAYGGPAMHLALYQKKLVEEKKYLSTEELLELYSLAQMLPGPSSTQTLTSIGYKFGGPLLAFLTLLIWVLPAFLLLTLSAVFIGLFEEQALIYLRYVNPVAVAFITVAGVKMIKKSISSKQGYYLAALAFVVAALLRHPLDTIVNMNTPWIFPIVLLIGGVISYIGFQGNLPQNDTIKVKIPWKFLITFVLIFISAGILGKISSNRFILLFENCYRFGSLVFGGGNVLIPMMLEQYVSHASYMTSEQFINGVGLVQAIPGPVFTISSYTGALAMQYKGILPQFLGSLSSTIGIFLPGALLIFFVYPIWKQIKTHPIVVKALPGVIAASCGLVLAAAYLMFLPVGFNWIDKGSFYFTNLDTDNLINIIPISIILVTSFLLMKTNIKSPWYILVAILAGILF